MRYINGLVGLGLILLGFSLASAPVFGIAQAPGTDAFHLIQFHFLIAGLSSVLVARSERNSQLGVSLSLMLLTVNIWIGGIAIIQGDVEFLWVLIFPVVSILNAVQVFNQDDLVEPDDIEQKEDEAGDNEFIPENFGAITTPQSRSVFGALLRLAIIIPAMFFAVALAFFYIELLQRVIFETATIDFVRLLAALVALARELWLYAAIYVVVYAGVILVQALTSTVAARSDLILADDANRRLSQRERQYIQSSIEALGDYLEGKSYGATPRVLMIVFFALPIGLMVGVPVLVLLLEELLAEGVQAHAAKNLVVLLSNGPAYLGGGISSSFFGIGVGWSLIQYIGARNKNVAEYLHAKAGWNSMETRERTLDEHLKILVRFVRLNRLSTDEAFQPSNFVYRAFREREKAVYQVTAVFGLLASVLTVADVHWFQIVHSEGIRYSRYIDFRPNNIGFSELDRVELQCFRYKPDDNGKTKLGVGYVLIRDGMVSVNVLRGEALTPEYLRQVQALDEKIKALGIPIIDAEHSGNLLGERSGNVENCQEALDSEFDRDIAKRLSSLLLGGTPKFPGKN
jgi:hypothetical protein